MAGDIFLSSVGPCSRTTRGAEYEVTTGVVSMSSIRSSSWSVHRRYHDMSRWAFTCTDDVIEGVD